MNIEDRLAALEERQRHLRHFVSQAYWGMADRLDHLTLPGRVMVCPICKHSAVRENLELRISKCIFGGGKLERYLCPHCGAVYGPAKYLDLTPEMIAADYGLLYADYNEGNSTSAEERAFRSLSPVIGKPYLNWGCGRWSESIPRLRSQGFDVWGYEPNSLASDNPFIVSTKGEISGRFAGIFSNNVLEHMLNPVDEFKYFHEILLPGGLMAHATPCYRYAYEYSRFHVIFLTGTAPEILAQRSGFRLISRDEDGEFMSCIFERQP